MFGSGNRIQDSCCLVWSQKNLRAAVRCRKLTGPWPDPAGFFWGSFELTTCAVTEGCCLSIWTWLARRINGLTQRRKCFPCTSAILAHTSVKVQSRLTANILLGSASSVLSTLTLNTPHLICFCQVICRFLGVFFLHATLRGIFIAHMQRIKCPRKDAEC